MDHQGGRWRDEELRRKEGEEGVPHSVGSKEKNMRKEVETRSLIEWVSGRKRSSVSSGRLVTLESLAGPSEDTL